MSKVLQTYWLVEQGMSNPREPANVGWRDFGAYGQEGEARKEYRRLGHISRLSRVEVVAMQGATVGEPLPVKQE